jgi:peptidoglycan-N-acetylglucosamine deacetylase
MKQKYFLIISLTIIVFQYSNAQITRLWNKKQCAVVLTYDDALNVHLENVIPALDSLNLKATFYLIGDSPTLSNRINEWRMAAKHGHELGNHTLFHPCDGSLPGRDWITGENDLNKITLRRAQEEIRVTNTLLQAIDGKIERTFAYPCGDTQIGGVNYYTDLQSEFVGARGVRAGLKQLNEIETDNIGGFGINGQSADFMIELVKQAMKSHTLQVFIFHGVGGGHSINVSIEAHRQLLLFLKQHKNEIWIAPMVDIARYIKKNQTSKNTL